MFSARVALAILLSSGGGFAQQYTISTVAGGSPPQTPAPGVNLSIGQTGAVSVDANGNLYFASLNSLWRLDQKGIVTLVAGNTRSGYSGDGGPAILAQMAIPLPGGTVVDALGNVYVSDQVNRIRKISPTGIISAVAGAGAAGFSGDGGPATSAQLNSPAGLAVDPSGNLFLADSQNHRVRKISPAGVITTVAGTGISSYGGDGGPAVNAQLSSPSSVAVDASGNLYIADRANYRIRKVSTGGTITTVIGDGVSGFVGDDGKASIAELTDPVAVTFDPNGYLYIVDGYRVRRMTPAGIIGTVAGNGVSGDAGDGGPALTAQLNQPSGVGVDSIGLLYISELGSPRIRKVLGNGNIVTVVGGGSSIGDGGAAVIANLVAPRNVARDGAGNLFIADPVGQRIRKVNPGGIISTVAGNGSVGSAAEGGIASASPLCNPSNVAVDTVGNLYIADQCNNRIRRVSTDGIITTFAGNGVFGYVGDGGPATSASLRLDLYEPGLALDKTGALYIGDRNYAVRKVSTDGTISTVAGNGSGGFSGDGGLATSAQLGFPSSLAVDGNGTLYIGERDGGRIRKVATNGIITTIAGNGRSGFSGDGGSAASASLSVFGLAIDSPGNLYLADASNCRVRKVSPDGIINTIAGSGDCGYTGDGGPALNAGLSDLGGLTIDGSGNVYLASTPAVRMLQPVPVLVNSVVNAATNIGASVSPGEIVVLYGSGLGPAKLVTASVGTDGLYPTQLAGTVVSFNGVRGPIVYTSATQVAAIVPYGISGSGTAVTCAYQGQASKALSVPVAPSSPGIFTLDSTGKGQAAAVNQDGSINTSGAPARIGDVILLYATGEGQTTPTGIDGKPASIPLPRPILPVSVTVGGASALVLYAGGAPGEVAGAMQINVVIPDGIQTGVAVPVVLTVGNTSSPTGVTIAVR